MKFFIKKFFSILFSLFTINTIFAFSYSYKLFKSNENKLASVFTMNKYLKNKSFSEFNLKTENKIINRKLKKNTIISQIGLNKNQINNNKNQAKILNEYDIITNFLELNKKKISNKENPESE